MRYPVDTSTSGRPLNPSQTERSTELHAGNRGRDRHHATAHAHDVELRRRACLAATRARHAPTLVGGKLSESLPGSRRQRNAVTVTVGWRTGDRGKCLDS